MSHANYMNRSLQLASLGGSAVSPNPMVGAVLVHQNLIIGEGYHQYFGGAHAEVNCLRSVEKNHLHLISESVLYVSLEPCAHFGKTPPCTDLIISNNIRHVIIGCRDPFPKVNGKGIEKLRQAGVRVELIGGLLENESLAINKRFFTYHAKKRPYIILKWAQTSDRFISKSVVSTFNESRLLISNEYSNRLVHKWRSEEIAILVGTNTAILDDPELTNRLWSGGSPVRMIIDLNLRLPHNLKIFKGPASTVIFNLSKHDIGEDETIDKIKSGDKVRYYKIQNDGDLVSQLISTLYKLGVLSVFVEGGRMLLQSFIDSGLSDECRVITNTKLLSHQGIHAPVVKKISKVSELALAADKIEIFKFN